QGRRWADRRVMTTATLPSYKLPHETVGEITKQAREVKFSVTLASFIGGLLFCIGWIVRKAFGVLWFAAVWCAIATRQGWRQAGGQEPAGPSLEVVLRENQRLRAELARVS